MTRTALRLAELEAIRDRPLTEAEQIEVKRLAHIQRQCAQHRQRYASDPAYRELIKARSAAWKNNRYASDPAFRQRMIERMRARRAAGLR